MADAVAFRIASAILARFAPLAAEVILSPTAEPQAFPALHLDDDGENVIAEEPFVTRAFLLITVVGYAEGSESEGLRAARNLDAAIVSAIMSEPTIDGLATQVNLGSAAFERVRLSSRSAVTFRRQFDVQFSYRSIDPTLLGG